VQVILATVGTSDVSVGFEAGVVAGLAHGQDGQAEAEPA